MCGDVEEWSHLETYKTKLFLKAAFYYIITQRSQIKLNVLFYMKIKLYPLFVIPRTSAFGLSTSTGRVSLQD
jgi:hypothetical protein